MKRATASVMVIYVFYKVKREKGKYGLDGGC